MQVEVLRKTAKPERLVCQAGRGDYFDGYVGDTGYAELMKGVEYDDDELPPELSDDDPSYDNEYVVEARIKHFVEKQLSRGHYGLWEHPQITLAVKGVSRVTMAQITRHRHMSFDVQSQRYVDFSDKQAIVPRSLEDTEHFSRETGAVDVENREGHERAFGRHTSEAFARYEQMVDDGVPKEDARFILPVGTPVNITMSGNARTMMHVLNLRQKANAQWEIRELSELVVDELEEWMPYTGAWWRENGPMRISP